MKGIGDKRSRMGDRRCLPDGRQAGEIGATTLLSSACPTVLPARRSSGGVRRATCYFLSAFSICCLLSAGFTGCASTKTAVKKGFNFSNIRKIAVIKFSGNGGAAVGNEFIRQFLASGISMVDRTDIENISDIKSFGVDAVISGNVLEFNPSSKLLIFKEKGDIVISDRVYPISGTTVLPTGYAFGLEDANVFTVSASVSVSAKIVDTKTGEVVWSDSNSYEGLDINTAVSSVVTSFKKSLEQYWKELR